MLLPRFIVGIWCLLGSALLACSGDSVLPAARLASYDIAAWSSYLDELMASGMDEPIFLTSLRPLFLSMPDSFRVALYQQVRERYPSAPKKIRSEIYGPKRVLDLLVRATFRADERILAALQSGKSARDAYRAYIGDLKREVFDGGEVGYFTADHILELCEGIQAPMVETSRRIGFYLTGPGAPSLTVFGSFPNGLSRLGSDLDLMHNYDTLRQAVPGILAHFRQVRPEWAWFFIRSAEDDTMEGHFAVVNPVTIRVKADGLSLRVFSSEVRPLPARDGVVKYEAPLLVEKPL